MFKLLDFFATNKNRYASPLYKEMTFSLIENHSDVDLREFILRNFIILLKKFPKIPIEIILEPMLK